MKKEWSVSFGRVKSMDIATGAIFKPQKKKNPYNKPASYRRLAPRRMTGTNSEIY